MNSGHVQASDSPLAFVVYHFSTGGMQFAQLMEKRRVLAYNIETRLVASALRPWCELGLRHNTPLIHV